MCKLLVATYYVQQNLLVAVMLQEQFVPFLQLHKLYAKWIDCCACNFYNYC